MNQGDCLRVQAAEIELEKAGRGVLPLEPAELAALLASPDPLPVSLHAGDRAMVASHLRNCPLCQEFWTEQTRLGPLLREAAFKLPEEADAVELKGLENTILRKLVQMGDLPLERQPVEDFQPNSAQHKSGTVVPYPKRTARLSWREGNVSRNNRKYWLVAAAALVVTFGVVYVSYFYPPVDQDQVQGAIGKRDVYRETNVTDKDVTVATGPAFTFDGLREYMKSSEFKKMRDDPNFKKMVSNQAEFTALVSNPAFAGLISGMQSGSNASQLVSGLGPLATYASQHEAAFMALFSSPEFNNAVLNCGSYASLMENKPLSVVVQSNPSFAAIVNSTQFKNAVNNSAVLDVLQQNSQLLANFGSILSNGAFNVCMTNATGANALFTNPAFTGMVANPSFVLANQLGTLQNNSAFNALANSNQFFGLLNDPNFHSLASTPQFLAFLNGAAAYQMASNKPLDSAGLENLANQSQFESLANNTNFNNLLLNGNFLSFLNHPSFPGLQTQYNLGSVILNQQVLSNVHNLADLNGMISQATAVNSTMFGVVM